VNNSRKTRRKCTHMSAAELKRIREAIGYDMRAMAQALAGMPYRTYQCYEYGDRGIPIEVADAVRALQQRDRDFMAKLRRRLLADIDRRFPGGIPSATTED
jgi:hypothetical protein